LFTRNVWTDHLDDGREPMGHRYPNKTTLMTAEHNESPIPCLGHWVHTVDGSDYDCDYEYAGHFGCEDCIVNGGRYDPRKRVKP
jgi:hypothetical protein